MHAQSTLKTIQLEAVARKIASIRNHDYPELLQEVTERPRLLELMIWIQGRSMLPGGLETLSRQIVEEFPERIGTTTMLNAKATSYSPAQKLAIHRELPECIRPCHDRDGDHILAVMSGRYTPEEFAEMEACDQRALETALHEIDAPFFQDLCRRAAVAKLPEWLAALCIDKDTRFDGFKRGVWFLQDPVSTLMEFMDRTAARVQQRLASTAVVRKVIETVDEVLETSEPCMIRGNTRFGKTESLKAIAEMHSGRVRFVAVPPGNSLRDLLLRIAEALGIDTTYGSVMGSLRTKIEYILNHTGLALIFDEGAWLIPENYSKISQPPRLNWVRSELLDRGAPVLIAVTPQWYDDRLKRYLKDTKYAMEQLIGRCPVVELPGMLEDEDLLRVAAVHFPEFKRKTDLLEIASEACTAESYLKAIEQISKHARYRAKREGVSLTMDLVRKSIVDIFPRPQAKSNSGEGGTQDRQVHAPLAVPRPVNGLLKPLSRGVHPAGMGTASHREGAGSFRRRDAECEERTPVPVSV
jgi:hypothetical protein